MNDLQRVFDYQGKPIRTVTLENGEPGFVVKDVCDILEISNSRDAIARLDDDEKGVVSTDTPGGIQGMQVVTESGIYSLVLSSRKPEAKQFKRWVTHEVLPSIRKNGMYATDNVIDQILDNPDYGIALLTKLKEERAARFKAEKTNAILMHVNKTYTATEIAKELGFKSAIALNNDLANKKIQFKQNGTWVLYSKHADNGYVEIKQEVHDNGHVIYHRRWTQLGREFLLKMFQQKAS